MSIQKLLVICLVFFQSIAFGQCEGFLYPYVWSNVATACPGTSISFSPAPQDADTYEWDFGDGISNSAKFISHAFDAVGVYNVKCTIKRNCGTDTTVSKNIVIEESSSFSNKIGTYTPDSLCPGQSSQFSAWNGVDTAIWTFSNGMVDTLGDVGYFSFTEKGDYTYSVRLIDFCGNDSVFTGGFYVGPVGGYSGGYPSFNHSDDTVCTGGLAYVSSSNVDSAHWTFSNGAEVITTDGVQYVAFDSPGTYNYEAYFVDLCGNHQVFRDTFIVQTQVYQLSPAIIAADTLCPGERFYFECDHYDAKWSFSDGDSITRNRGLKSFSSLGTYTYLISINERCGNDTSFTGTIVVGGKGEFASSVALNDYPDTLCLNETGTFSLSGYSLASAVFMYSNGEIDSATWHSDDFSSNVAGDYTFSVKATDGCAREKTFEGNFVVGDKPGAFESDFYVTYLPYGFLCVGEQMTLSIEGPYRNVIWQSEEGVPDSTNAQISVSSSTEGSYSVSAKVYDLCGNDSTFIVPYDVYSSGNCANSVRSINDKVMKMSPNPASNTVRISSSKDGIITISNQLGQLYLTKKIVAGTTNIDLINYNTGTYIVSFVTDKSITSQILFIEK
jgi:hypothetical protein